MKKRLLRLRHRYVWRIMVALGASCAVSIFLLLARAVDAGNSRYYFLVWNLILAIVPLVLSVWLRVRLRSRSWLELKNLILTGFWLLFLPNSFYLMTDLIHIHQTYEVNIYYDIVMFMSFIINGLITGMISVYLVHVELARRVRRRDAHIVIGLVLLTASFAIYLGRFLRWNSWDVFLHPAGVLFDVSNELINPVSPSAFVTTTSFFMLLAASYTVVWNVAMYMHSLRNNH